MESMRLNTLITKLLTDSMRKKHVDSCYTVGVHCLMLDLAVASSRHLVTRHSTST